LAGIKIDKMADIILIQPEIGEMDFLRTQPFLPLNLLHAATLVAKSYDIRLIDQRIDKNWQKTLSDELSGPVLCVGLTTYTGKMISSALEISRFVKERSNAPVVWGGIHASLLPEQTLRNMYIDIVVQGEGEITFFELAEALKKKASLRGIEGLWFKEKGEIHQNPQRPSVELNDLPDIPYHLVDVGQYMPMYRKRPSIALQTSRGCIYHCSYCYNTAYNSSTWRSLSAENTIKRIKNVVNKFKAGNIYIIDDNFFIDLDRAKKITEGIIKENLNIEWQIQGVGFNEIEKMDDAYLKLLEESGCVRLTCGLESGSERIRKILNKTKSIKSIVQINRRLSKYKILVFYSFITGLPGETLDDLRKTIGIIFQILKENRMARNSPIYTFVPYPQTPLIKMLEKEGYNFPDKLTGWENYDFGNLGYEGIPYVSDDLRKIIKLNFLYYLCFFLDKKLLEYETSKIIKFLALIYKPIARFRVRHLFFGLALDKKILELGLKLTLKHKK
jgi:anaerobic magnesium-protoporphyrin IX monomethyl ester cyclase